MDAPSSIERRVYAAELAVLLSCSADWIYKLEKREAIPPARRDPGGRRKFWLEHEARAIVEAGRAPAAPGTVPPRKAKDSEDVRAAPRGAPKTSAS